MADAIDVLNQQPPPRPAMHNSPVAACLPALIDRAERDPTLRRLHHHYNDRRRDALVTAIAAAVEDGDVRSNIDPELAAVAVAGAVVYRRLMTSRPLCDDEVEPLIDTVLGW